MEFNEFTQLKKQFENSNVEQKIDIYVSSEGLSSLQYKELLSLFPMEQLDKLENALDNA